MRPWGTAGEICAPSLQAFWDPNQSARSRFKRFGIRIRVRALASSGLGSESECAVSLQAFWDPNKSARSRFKRFGIRIRVRGLASSVLGSADLPGKSRGGGWGAGESGGALRALGRAGAFMVAARRRRRSSAAEGSPADMQRLVACRRPIATTRNAVEAEGDCTILEGDAAVVRAGDG